MPLFDSRGLGPAVVVVELLAVVALVFAVVGHIERSSDSAFTEFLAANALSASEPDHAIESLAAVQPDPKRKTGCPVGNKVLPTKLWCLRWKMRLKRTEHLPDEDLIFEGHAFRIVLFEPDFRGVLAGEHLDVLGIAKLLAGVDVDQDGRLPILWVQPIPMYARSNRGRGRMSQALDGRPFLTQAAFLKLTLKVREFGFKQPSISADVAVMGAQTGEFLVGHGASVWIKKIYSGIQKTVAGTFNAFMKSKVRAGVYQGRFTLARL
jgi:hypothetical protein